MHIREFEQRNMETRKITITENHVDDEASSQNRGREMEQQNMNEHATPNPASAVGPAGRRSGWGLRSGCTLVDAAAD